MYWLHDENGALRIGNMMSSHGKPCGTFVDVIHSCGNVIASQLW